MELVEIETPALQVDDTVRVQQRGRCNTSFSYHKPDWWYQHKSHRADSFTRDPLDSHASLANQHGVKHD